MQNELEIKLDAQGNVDTQYYINKAYEMRREYHAELFKSAKNAVKSLLRLELPKLHIGRHAHH